MGPAVPNQSADLESAAVPPIRQREPYAVERFPAAPGFVRLVGYDRHGEFMVEFTIPARKYSARVPDKFRKWLEANDDGAPTLSLI